jgi:hypothetical protein
VAGTAKAVKTYGGRPSLLKQLAQVHESPVLPAGINKPLPLPNVMGILTEKDQEILTKSR